HYLIITSVIVQMYARRSTASEHEMRRIQPPHPMPCGNLPATLTGCTYTPKTLANGFHHALKNLSCTLTYLNGLGFAGVDFTLHGLNGLVDSLFEGESALGDIRIVARNGDLQLTHFVIGPARPDLAEAHLSLYDAIVKLVERRDLFTSELHCSFRGLEIRCLKQNFHDR